MLDPIYTHIIVIKVQLASRSGSGSDIGVSGFCLFFFLLLEFAPNVGLVLIDLAPGRLVHFDDVRHAVAKVADCVVRVLAGSACDILSCFGVLRLDRALNFNGAHLSCEVGSGGKDESGSAHSCLSSVCFQNQL